MGPLLEAGVEERQLFRNRRSPATEGGGSVRWTSLEPVLQGHWDTAWEERGAWQSVLPENMDFHSLDHCHLFLSEKQPAGAFSAPFRLS